MIFLGIYHINYGRGNLKSTKTSFVCYLFHEYTLYHAIYACGHNKTSISPPRHQTDCFTLLKYSKTKIYQYNKTQQQFQYEVILFFSSVYETFKANSGIYRMQCKFL